MEKKRVYNFINIGVLIAAILIFYKDYIRKPPIFEGRNVLSMSVLIFSVVIVHFIKAARLFIALYGTRIRWIPFIKTYCKATPVSVIYPLKAGEFFRIYCYGREIGNLVRAVIIVLLDRFMDTLALVTIILAVKFVNGGTLSQIEYILLLFLMVVLIIYHVFPGIFIFWKRHLLSSKATERRMRLLKFLETLHNVQNETSDVTKGRGFLLYAFSLTAWSVELGSVALITDFGGDDVSGVISNYLSSALGIGQSAELRQFVFVSVILLLLVYVGIKVYEALGKGLIKKK